MPNWEPAALGPQWPTVEQPSQDEEEVLPRSKEELWIKITVCPRLKLISHTQPTSTLSRLKCERLYFYKEVCSFVHWSSYIMFDYVSAYICIRIRAVECGYTTSLLVSSEECQSIFLKRFFGEIKRTFWFDLLKRNTIESLSSYTKTDVPFLSKLKNVLKGWYFWSDPEIECVEWNSIKIQPELNSSWAEF